VDLGRSSWGFGAAWSGNDEKKTESRSGSIFFIGMPLNGSRSYGHGENMEPRNSGRDMQSIRFMLSFDGDLLQAAISQYCSSTQGIRQFDLFMFLSSILIFLLSFLVQGRLCVRREERMIFDPNFLPSAAEFLLCSGLRIPPSGR